MMMIMDNDDDDNGMMMTILHIYWAHFGFKEVDGFEWCKFMIVKIRTACQHESFRWRDLSVRVHEPWDIHNL